MKAILVRSAFLYISCIFVVQVNAMDAKFRGSAEEVEKQLHAMFPIGMHKNEVISIAKSRLQLDESGFDSHDYGEVPLVTEIYGETVNVHSWIKMKVAEYRSIRHLFIKTSVIATYLFDDNDNLIAIDVQVSGDSL